MDGFATALPNEIALVSRAVDEPAAFAHIYDHYFSRIYNYVRYRVRDGTATDDITAEIFERTLRSIHRYRPERAPFSAWLFAIARHAVADYRRAQKRHRWLSLDMVNEKPDRRASPEEVAMHHETEAELLRALADLTERERDIIALKFAGGMANREIAGLVKLSESNVGVILYRAMRKLRAKLATGGDQNER
jgi:RNA polymerase sigma-70 factor (ECF subfamily)